MVARSEEVGVMAHVYVMRHAGYQILP
jgi:hypothetical protein